MNLHNFCCGDGHDEKVAEAETDATGAIEGVAKAPARRMPQRRAPDSRSLRRFFFSFFPSRSCFDYLDETDVQREEKNVQKAIKEAAKRNDMGSAKVFIFVYFFYFNSLESRF